MPLPNDSPRHRTTQDTLRFALLAAVALLEQHDSAASVVIWEGKRRVLQCIRAERDEGPPSAVLRAARSRTRP